ncbi:helix-turn-helix domain-containing protein [Cohnella sp. GbtcB17]|uniref:helix-turn-helix domain-containing protein n=1 Tax=Cohnella sp. GbtcB17 TaxID=2824762 RepID=UPI001C305711|nr:AraC family transcriptional regulator [Cohnella sp. GbtcB17]
MSFQQMNAVIPQFRNIEIVRESRLIVPEPGLEKLVIVRQGYLIAITEMGETRPVSQGYACHSAAGPVKLQPPAGREAEYAVLAYRIVPEGAPWDWNGPQRLLSENKVRYMVDGLLQAQEDLRSLDGEAAEAQRFRNRMMLERILSFFMYEGRLNEERRHSDAQIEKSVHYLEEHYMLKLTLPMLAERAGLSAGHFGVLFKARTGMTPSRYLKRLRVAKAKQLFDQGERSANKAAQSVGFADYFHFSRTYKELTGMSPSEYIHQLTEIE